MDWVQRGGPCFVQVQENGSLGDLSISQIEKAGIFNLFGSHGLCHLHGKTSWATVYTNGIPQRTNSEN